MNTGIQQDSSSATVKKKSYLDTVPGMLLVQMSVIRPMCKSN